MDYTDLVGAFWNNVSRLKEQRRLTWKDAAVNTGHTGASLSSMRSGHKMSSMGIALSIAMSLGITIEELCSDDDVSAGGRTLRDVLYRVTDGLNEINMVNLISFTEEMQKIQPEEYPSGVNLSNLGYDKEFGVRTLGEKIEYLKKNISEILYDRLFLYYFCCYRCSYCCDSLLREEKGGCRR